MREIKAEHIIADQYCLECPREIHEEGEFALMTDPEDCKDCEHYVQHATDTSIICNYKGEDDEDK